MRGDNYHRVVERPLLERSVECIGCSGRFTVMTKGNRAIGPRRCDPCKRIKATENSSRWAKKAPEKHLIKVHRYRTRKALSSASDDESTVEDRIRELNALDESPCAYCSRVLPRKKLEIEHIVPISRGGLHSAENLTLACKSCNSSKRDRILWLEWIPSNHRQKHDERRQDREHDAESREDHA